MAARRKLRYAVWYIDADGERHLAAERSERDGAQRVAAALRKMRPRGSRAKFEIEDRGETPPLAEKRVRHAAPFGVAFNVAPIEAIVAAVKRGVVLPDEFYEDLPTHAARHAFTISGIEAIDQIEDVLRSLTLSIANGETFEQWQARAARELATLPRARRELIFRNAVQSAYGVGRTEQQRENADSRPYLMWDAINDSRTRPAHRAMDGYVAPVGDPIWKRWSPPAGHNCRCTRISLTAEQARRRGLGKPPPPVEPDAGFGYEAADADAEDTMLGSLVGKRLTALPSRLRDAVSRYFDENIPSV